jgi:uncharacterized repeat protein (TIGR03803 family)
MLIGTFTYAQYSTLLNFSGVPSGNTPVGSLISDGTFLYGMTPDGGTYNLGTIFKIMSDGTGYEKLLDFDGTTNGSSPHGSLISDGNFLYGMTTWGGQNNLGTIFKIMPDGTGYMKLLDYAGVTNGSYPMGSLNSDGIFLYGMTSNGGTSDQGTIFKIMPDGTGYVKLMDFDGATNGSAPQGSLISEGTFLYGMTSGGGTSGSGTIFKIMPDGTDYLKLLDFDGFINGSAPNGDLIFDGTFMYGMTTYGGANDIGTIFKIMPNGTGYIKLLDFAGITNGRWPYGSLVYDGPFLYGMTVMGGTNDLGTLFKIMPDGTEYTKLFDFAGFTNGSNPNGSLITDGTFMYGMLADGGTNNNGVIFKFGMTAGISEKNMEPEFTIYPNPTTGIINLSTSVNGLEFISITNILGEAVLSKEVNVAADSPFTIDMRDHQAGIYFLRVGNCTKRIIRE